MTATVHRKRVYFFSVSYGIMAKRQRAWRVENMAWRRSATSGGHGGMAKSKSENKIKRNQA